MNDGEMLDSIESIAAQNGSAPDLEPGIEGTDQQLSLVVGGEAPTLSVLRLKGGPFTVAGQLNNGDVIDLHITCEVREVGFTQKRHKDGYPLGTERRHIAQIETVERVG